MILPVEWTDAYWTDYTHYPFLTKYNDLQTGSNDMYMIRLPDILFLRAEAYNNGSDITDAATLVNEVRARVGLPPTTAASQADMALGDRKGTKT